VIERFALEAHGMSLDGMSGVTQLARQTKIDFEELPQAVATYRLGVVENPWREGLLRLRIKECQSDLGKRVKGQPQAVARSLDTLKRAVMGMSGSHTGNPTSRPRGVLFFAGPTGVGKTELAKAMAQLVYGDEGALLRFDMSEFAEAHTADRLIGAPPGYVGYDAGGQLTNAVRSQPFRVILFDEIDKAHPLVLDKFLQILEDGRLTDGHGETTYFSESILIFTSNLGVQETDPRTGETKNLIEPGTPYQEVEKAVHTAIGHHFKTKLKRPELLNRIGDNIIVFDFIGSQAAEAIFVAQMENVATLIEREHDLSIEVPSHLVEKLRQKCTRDTTFGGRGIGNQLEAYFVNPLARTLFDNDFAPGSALVVVSLNDRDFPASIEVANRE
jgi:ATP-dependent Clp protease ATP-binding subunit ClpB